jgi:glutathione-regulated potassium-efflux system protein KefB
MHLDQLLLALFILLSVVGLAVTLFTDLGLGSVLGLLVAGFIVGPSGLAITQRVAELREVSELGIALLLFIIGLEMRPEKLWSLRRVVFGLGPLQVLVTGVVLAIYALVTIKTWQAALVLGFGFALSSTAFGVQLLEERHAMTTEYGTASFGILLFQDLAIVPLLAMVPLLSNQDDAAQHAPFVIRLVQVAAALGAVVLFGRFVAPWWLGRALRRVKTDVFSVVVFIGVIGAALAMQLAGLSMALGTFLIGMLLSGSPHRAEIETVVVPFKGMMLGLFFVAVGMAIDVRVLVSEGARIAAHMVVLMVIKALLLYGLSRAFGLSRDAALRIALLLPQCGEFGFVLFGAAVSAGVMPNYGFVCAALLISMSMAATPLLARLSDRFAGPASEPVTPHP